MSTWMPSTRPLSKGIFLNIGGNREFELITRSMTLNHKICEGADVKSYLSQLLDKTAAGFRRVCLLGVSFSKLDGVGRLTGRQLDIFRNHDHNDND